MDRSPLDVDALRAALSTRWARVDVVAETGSTNTDLLADTGAPDRSVLAAEYQLAGRGRLDRRWISPRHAGLSVSVLLRPDVALPRWGWLPLLAGVALSEAVTETSGVPTALKWPNDLLAVDSGLKLAGILAQVSGTAVVIGIGINVSTTAAELPVDTATSLGSSGAPADLDRTTLLIAILHALQRRYTRWCDTGGDAVACGLQATYRTLSATLGRPVRVRLGGDTVLVGDAVDLDEIGRLQVRAADGVHSIGAGDVEQLRTT